MRRRTLGFYLNPTQQAYYGSGTIDAGTTENYSQYANDLLNPASEATTATSGGDVTQYISPQATASGAAQLAALLGGRVVPLPNNTTWAGSVPGGQWAIQMPDGRILDATAVANVIGNNAAYPTPETKQGAINDMVDARYVPVYGNGNPTGVATIPAGARTPASQPAGGSGSTNNGPAPGRVALANLSTGNAAVIHAGVDHWQIAISGAAPNASVTVRARKDGGAESATVYGKTDAAGNFSIDGVSAAGDIGAWAQTWTAGTATVGTLNFSIVAAGSGAAGSGTGSGSDGKQGNDGAAAGFNFNALLDQLKTLPTWAWAAALGGVMLLRGGGRR